MFTPCKALRARLYIIRPAFGSTLWGLCAPKVWPPQAFYSTPILVTLPVATGLHEGLEMSSACWRIWTLDGVSMVKLQTELTTCHCLVAIDQQLHSTRSSSLHLELCWSCTTFLLWRESMFWLVEAQYQLVGTSGDTSLIPVHIPGIYLPYTRDQHLFLLFSKPRGQGIIEIFYTVEGINFFLNSQNFESSLSSISISN
jgi:hypothetical protein